MKQITERVIRDLEQEAEHCDPIVKKRIAQCLIDKHKQTRIKIRNLLQLVLANEMDVDMISFAKKYGKVYKEIFENSNSVCQIKKQLLKKSN